MLGNIEQAALIAATPALSQTDKMCNVQNHLLTPGRELETESLLEMLVVLRTAQDAFRFALETARRADSFVAFALALHQHVYFAPFFL